MLEVPAARVGAIPGLPLIGGADAGPGSAPTRVLAFVEACGVTGALRNLLDAASHLKRRPPPVLFEVATYRRVPGASSRDAHGIDVCIDAVRATGLPVHVLEERRAGDPALVQQVRALIDRVRPDVVETHHVKSHLLVALARASRPWVAFHHGYTATDLKVRACNFCDYWSLRRASRVLTPCRAFAREVARCGVRAERVSVIHSAVTPAAYDAHAAGEVRRTLGLGSGQRLVVAAGRLSREKAHSVLVAALAQPHLTGNPSLVLAILGEGPERSALEAQAARLGVGARVRLPGYCDNPWPYYYAADATVLPSDSEGSPNALLEAMAAGRPIVATRVGGVPEILAHGDTGLLVPRRSPVALARALADVLIEPRFGEALGRRAREVALTEFTLARRADALAALYQEAAACVS